MTAPLEWIVLADFTPGIVHNLGFNAIGTPAGFAPGLVQEGQVAASIENTYRCISLPGGGLGPLPRRDAALDDSGHAAPLFDPTLGDQPWYLSFHVVGPVFPDTLTNKPRIDVDLDTDEPHPVLMFVAAQGALDNGDGTFDWSWQNRAYRVWKDGWTNPSYINIGSAVTFDTKDFYEGSPTYWAFQHFNTGTPTEPGVGSLTYAWLSTNGGTDIAEAYPNPSGTGHTDSVKDWSGVASLKSDGIPLGHQNRLVFLARNFEFFGAAAVTVDNSLLSFTLPNSESWDSDSFFGPEYVGGYGAWGSLSASDLLLVQHRDGGLLVQGDLAAPIVRKLPGIIGTNGTECLGAQTPLGFVYGVNRGGVQVWQGGDGSISLSPQLPPDFWQHPDSKDIKPFRGRFDTWDDWIMCPNGFIYSMTSEAWWRMDDPDEYVPYMWHASPVGSWMYAITPKAGNSDLLSDHLVGYNRGRGANNYSYQSQPFFIDANRRVRIRELVLVAQGTGTVRVDISEADHTVDSTTFELDSAAGSNPQVLRHTIGAHDLTMARVRIIATGENDDPAPVVYRLHVGWARAEHTAGVANR